MIAVNNKYGCCYDLSDKPNPIVSITSTEQLGYNVALIHI